LSPLPQASLRELVAWLGLARADSVPNLTRRLDARLKASPALSEEMAEIFSRATAPAGNKPPASLLRNDDPPGS
jgi:hypothetical protein